MSPWHAAVKVRRSWQVIVAGTAKIHTVWLLWDALSIGVSSLEHMKSRISFRNRSMI
jgi:hypothetical protein